MVLIKNDDETTASTGRQTPQAAPLFLAPSLPFLDLSVFKFIQHTPDLNNVLHLAALYKIHQEVLSSNGIIVQEHNAKAVFECFVERVDATSIQWIGNEGVKPSLMVIMKRNKEYLLADKITEFMKLAVKKEDDDSCDPAKQPDEDVLANRVCLQGHVTRGSNGQLTYGVSWVRHGLFISEAVEELGAMHMILPTTNNGVKWVTDARTWPNDLAVKLRITFLHRLYEYNSIVGVMKAREHLGGWNYPFMLSDTKLEFLKLEDVDKFSPFLKPGVFKDGVELPPRSTHV